MKVCGCEARSTRPTRLRREIMVNDLDKALDQNTVSPVCTIRLRSAVLPVRRGSRRFRGLVPWACAVMANPATHGNQTDGNISTRHSLPLHARHLRLVFFGGLLQLLQDLDSPCHKDFHDLRTFFQPFASAVNQALKTYLQAGFQIAATTLPPWLDNQKKRPYLPGVWQWQEQQEP